MYLKEIGLLLNACCAQNLLTTLGSIVNIIEGQPSCFIYGSSTFDFQKS